MQNPPAAALPKVASHMSTHKPSTKPFPATVLGGHAIATGPLGTHRAVQPAGWGEDKRNKRMAMASVHSTALKTMETTGRMGETGAVTCPSPRTVYVKSQGECELWVMLWLWCGHPEHRSYGSDRRGAFPGK